VKAVSFIPIVARLAIEFGSFEEKERGGLSYQYGGGKNILKHLMGSDKTETIDDTYLEVLKKMEQLDFLKKKTFKVMTYYTNCAVNFILQKRDLGSWSDGILPH
jgi:hypothetical protein